MFDWIKSAALTFLIGLAVVLSVLLFTAWGQVELAKSERRTAEAKLDTEQQAHGRTRDAVAAQKRLADQQLRAANASVLAQQKRLDEEQLAQARATVANGQVVAGLRADLLALRRTLSVRNAEAAAAGGRGGGGAAGQGQAWAGAGGGGGNGAQAGGLLPAATAGPRDEEDDEDDDALDADTINLAYASCRTDAIAIRRALE